MHRGSSKGQVDQNTTPVTWVKGPTLRVKWKKVWLRTVHSDEYCTCSSYHGGFVTIMFGSQGTSNQPAIRDLLAGVHIYSIPLFDVNGRLWLPSTLSKLQHFTTHIWCKRISNVAFIRKKLIQLLHNRIANCIYIVQSKQPFLPTQRSKRHSWLKEKVTRQGPPHASKSTRGATVTYIQSNNPSMTSQAEPPITFNDSRFSNNRLMTDFLSWNTLSSFPSLDVSKPCYYYRGFRNDRRHILRFCLPASTTHKQTTMGKECLQLASSTPALVFYFRSI